MPSYSVAVASLPDFEESVRYASKSVLDVLGRVRGWDITLLLGDEANRESLLQVIHDKDPKLIILVGHGTEGEVTGQDYEPIYWACSNGSVKNRIIYALSCRCGAVLGHDLVEEKGAESFIGFNDYFIFASAGEPDPIADPVAQYFFRPTAKLLESLMTGKTAGEAVKEAREEYRRVLTELARLGADWAPQLMALVIHDRDSLVLIGNPDSHAGVGHVVTHEPLKDLTLVSIPGIVTYILTRSPAAALAVTGALYALKRLSE